MKYYIHYLTIHNTYKLNSAWNHPLTLIILFNFHQLFFQLVMGFWGFWEQYVTERGTSKQLRLLFV
jgi:hypothetical protein